MTDTSLLGLTAEIVAAHVSNNHMTSEALPALISSIYSTLATVGTAASPTSGASDKRVPVVPIKKLKMLKHHLAASYNLTPEKYWEKWRLPASYPMVAPDYAAKRSALAKTIGLGRKPAPATEKKAAKPAAGRGKAGKA